ncbi:RNA polymerase sigma factor SigF [soil metagenome]
MTATTPPPDELDLFRSFVTTQDRRIRNTLVERYMGLAAHIAKRYQRAGNDDDVRQAAMIGLVKAVDRFDPEYGVPFASFAGTTIEGELKRYLRDHTWVVRVPRSAKELHLLVRRTSDELAQKLGRRASIDEIAAKAVLDRDDVLRGLAATAAYDIGSLDGATDDGFAVNDRSSALASEELGFGHAIDSEAVQKLLVQLPERERQIVTLSFFDERSQAEIADILGISQMHVSRLLRRSLELMREASPNSELAV